MLHECSTIRNHVKVLPAITLHCHVYMPAWCVWKWQPYLEEGNNGRDVGTSQQKAASKPHSDADCGPVVILGLAVAMMTLRGGCRRKWEMEIEMGVGMEREMALG